MTFLRLAVDANVTQAKGVTEKRAMRADLHSDDLLLDRELLDGHLRPG